MSEEKKQQVIALGDRAGRCGALNKTPASAAKRRPLPKTAGVPMRPPGRWGHAAAKPAIEMTPDLATASAVLAEPLPALPRTQTGLAQGRNAKGIWQDNVANGFGTRTEAVGRR